jgi:hypothetical protein
MSQNFQQMVDPSEKPGSGLVDPSEKPGSGLVDPSEAPAGADADSSLDVTETGETEKQKD